MSCTCAARRVFKIAALLTAFHFGAGHAALEPRAGVARRLCEQALERGRKDVIPLSAGLLPPDFRQRVLKSKTEVEQFADHHQRSPWLEELESLNGGAFENGKVIYVSEIGPTLWTQSDLESWVRAIRQNLASEGHQARQALFHLAAGEPDKNFPTEARVRVRNSFLAYLEGRRHGDVFEGTILADSPSLNLPFEQDRSWPKRISIQAMGPEDYVTVKRVTDALWISRTLLRYALIKRKLEAGQLIDVDTDTAFFLSAYPELVPIWRIVRNWNVKMSGVPMRAHSAVFQAPALQPDPDYKDQVVLHLAHRMSTLGQGRWAENAFADLTLQPDRRFEARRFDQLRTWFNSAWRDFTRSAHLRPLSPPPMNPIDGGRTWVIRWKDTRQIAAAIQFYAYISHHP